MNVSFLQREPAPAKKSERKGSKADIFKELRALEQPLRERLYPAIEEMLSQDRSQGATLADGYAMLAAALGVTWPPEAA